MQHFFSFLNGFVAGGMRRVTFLPQKFGSSEKQAGTHFPTNNVGPLIDQNGQIAIGLNPTFVGVPDNSF